MYNSQYYTCEQIDQRLLQGYLDDYNTQNNTNLTKAEFLTLLFNTIGRNNTVDNLVTQIGYYECDTAAGTAAKAITVANYNLFAGGSMKVKFVNKNTANNATLNINSQGAKALYYQGERASSTNSWDEGEVVEIYYDGTSYYANNVKGGSGSGVYDVSVEHPNSGPNGDGKFTLGYILNPSNVNELIPVNKRYPGMSIRFVSTYDNKYVQARCMAQNFTTDVTQWQTSTSEIIAGSQNLIESGSVKKSLLIIEGKQELTVSVSSGFGVTDYDVVAGETYIVNLNTRGGLNSVYVYTGEGSPFTQLTLNTEVECIPAVSGYLKVYNPNLGTGTPVFTIEPKGNIIEELKSVKTISDNIKNGFVFAGIATPTTVPVSGKVFYVALQAGTYINFGDTAVTEGITILKYNGTSWVKEQVLFTDGGVFDISAYHATGGTLATYADLSAALDSNNGGGVPQLLQKGGMLVKFVRTVDNRYVQCKLNTQNWSINPKDWKEIADKTDLTSCINYDSTNILKKLIDDSIQTANASGVIITNNGNGTYTLHGTSTGPASVELVADKSATSDGYFTLENGIRYYATYRSISGTTSRKPYIFLKYCGGSSNINVDGKVLITGNGGQIGRFAINIQAANVTFDNYVIAPYLALESGYNEDYRGYTNLIIEKSLEPDFNSNALVPSVGIHQYINKKVLGALYQFTITSNNEGVTSSAILKNEDVYITIANSPGAVIQCKLALYDTLAKSDVYIQSDYTQVAANSTVNIHLDSSITVVCNKYTVLRLVAASGTVLKYAVISSDAIIRIASIENAKVIGPYNENTLTSFRLMPYRIYNNGENPNYKWDNVGSHDVIPAVPGRTYTIKGCASIGYFQWLRSYPTPVLGELADLSAIDPATHKTENGQIITLTCPADASYLYILTAISNEDRRPEYIIENAMESKFVLFDARITDIEDDVSILNGYANKFVKQDTTNVLRPAIELSGNKTGAGVTVTKNQDGTYTLNGTSTLPTSIEMVADKSSGTTGYFELEEGVQYYCTFKVLSGTATVAPNIFLKYCGGSSNIVFSTSKYAITGTGGQIGRFAINIQVSGRTFNNYVIAPYVAKATEYVDEYDGLSYIKARQSGITEVEKVNLVSPLQKELLMQEDYVTNALNSIYSSALTDGYDVAIGLFADPHSIDYLKYRKYRYLKEHGFTLFNICLGDVEPYHFIGTSKPVVISKIQEAISISGLTDTDLYAIGNHDAAITNPNNGVLLQSYNLTKREWYNLFIKHLSKSAVFDSANPMGGYYYTDFADANLRVIVLNTSEIYENDGTLSKKYTESVIVRQHQIDWLANKALDFTDKEEPSTWHVLVCGHSAFLQDFIAKILAAVKQGTSIDASTTVNKMLTYDSSTNSWGSPVDASGSFVLTANKDFSSQGPVDVIAQLYGHIHNDTYLMLHGIATLQFLCDNGELDSCAMIPVQGITAGNYKFVYRDKTFYFTITTDDPSATALGINTYHYGADYMFVYIYHGDNRMLNNRTSTTTVIANATDITPSTYTPERHSGTITTESGKFITFDYTNRKLRIYGIGVHGNHVLDY